MDKSNSMRNSRSSLRKSTDNFRPASSKRFYGSNSSLNKSNQNDLYYTSGSINRLEQEYVQNLQTQIRCLELENQHLREQSRRMSQVGPVMHSEAEKMLDRIKIQQEKISDLDLEVYRRENEIKRLTSQMSNTQNELRSSQALKDSENDKLQLTNLDLKTRLENMEKSAVDKDYEIGQLNDQLAKLNSQLKSQQTAASFFRDQANTETDRTKKMEQDLTDKNLELIDIERKIKQLEAQYATQFKESSDMLKGDINQLRTKLSEKHEECEYLRTKLSDEEDKKSSQKRKLLAHITELETSLSKEKDHLSRMIEKNSRENDELRQSMASEKQLHDQVKSLRNELAAQTDLNTELHIRVGELETSLADAHTKSNSRQHELLDDNKKLRATKDKLMRYVESLQDEIKSKDARANQFQTSLRELESRLGQLESIKNKEESMHSKRWRELESTMASLKSHAHAMSKIHHEAGSTRNASTRNASPKRNKVVVM